MCPQSQEYLGTESETEVEEELSGIVKGIGPGRRELLSVAPHNQMTSSFQHLLSELTFPPSTSESYELVLNATKNHYMLFHHPISLKVVKCVNSTQALYSHRI